MNFLKIKEKILIAKNYLDQNYQKIPQEYLKKDLDKKMKGIEEDLYKEAKRIHEEFLVEEFKEMQLD